MIRTVRRGSTSNCSCHIKSHKEEVITIQPTKNKNLRSLGNWGIGNETKEVIT